YGSLLAVHCREDFFLEEGLRGDSAAGDVRVEVRSDEED
ncbi:hypothetical protein A2U01_0067231, partial [Trifolium medium]|nr:hypothetical protein [Trifolium medium]